MCVFKLLILQLQAYVLCNLVQLLERAECTQKKKKKKYSYAYFITLEKMVIVISLALPFPSRPSFVLEGCCCASTSLT